MNFLKWKLGIKTYKSYLEVLYLQREGKLETDLEKSGSILFILVFYL